MSDNFLVKRQIASRNFAALKCSYVFSFSKRRILARSDGSIDLLHIFLLSAFYENVPILQDTINWKKSCNVFRR